MAHETLVRVIIVDDHAIVRSGLANFLNAFDDLTLVGEADNGQDALRLCEELQPDVVLMDLVMPGMDGIETTRTIRAQFTDMPILILTSFGEDHKVQAALQAGAIGYILKNTSIHDMAQAIRAAHAGQSTLSPEATQALIRANTKVPDHVVELKARELEVLELLANGLTNPQIAEILALSVSTIKFYVSSILEKLNVDTRTEAVVWALEHDVFQKNSGAGE